MNIAIYGGSFDPPHIGHIDIVECAIKALLIEKLVVVPTFLSPFKSHSDASALQRLVWLQKVFDGFANVEVSDFEVKQKRPVPSIETVIHFKKQCKGTLYFIIGADNLTSLHRWHRFSELDSMVTWVVASRNNLDIPDTMLTLHINKTISSRELRETMQRSWLSECIADEIITFYTKEKP